MSEPVLEGLISLSELRERTVYETDTGAFRWKIRPKRSHYQVGDRIGCQDKNGRWVTKLNGRQYLISRLAWFYMTGQWPAVLIDHKNTDHTDDRWANLREATHRQNNGNMSRHKDNKSGFKGVVWCPNTKKWRGQINKCGVNNVLGYSDDPVEVHKLYIVAACEYYGEFARAA